MKTRVLLLVAILAVGFITSCGEDDPLPAPSFGELELGNHDSADGKEAHIGDELHVDVEIEAPAKIDRISIDIHKEDGGTEADEIEVTYDSSSKYGGLLNADFHEDIPIPATVSAGEYHFHMTVVDMAGNSTSLEADIMITIEDD